MKQSFNSAALVNQLFGASAQLFILTLRKSILLLLFVLFSISGFAQNALDLAGLTSAAYSANAYSVRRLSTSYSGNLIKVRRSSDNATSDIGYDVNGYLDTAALKTFVTSNSAFVDTWYDQSGNGLSMTQATAGTQPRIVNAGVIDRVNGLPAVYFNGSNNLATVAYTAFGSGFTTCVVGKIKSNTTFSTFGAKTNSNIPNPLDAYNTVFLVGNGSSNDSRVLTVGIAASAGFSQWTFGADASQMVAYNLGTNNISSSSAPIAYGDASLPLYLGSRADLATSLDGYISEFTMFPVVLSGGNRGTFECSQMNYFMPITGSTTLSTTITTQLANPLSSGTWSSASVGVATIGTTGLVSGVGAGSSVISYSLTGGCRVTTTVTVKSATSGLSFDGTNDNVNFGNPASLQFAGSGAFTTEFWINPNTTAGGWYGVLDKSFWNSYTGFLVYIETGSIKVSLGGAGLAILAATLSASTWTHIAITYSNGSWVLYENGVSAATASSASYTNSTSSWLLGQRNDNTATGTTDAFGGQLDEVRIWNVARTQAQIQASMNTDVSQNANLVAYYRFDEGTAAGTNTSQPQTIDYSGNGNCATLNNFSLSGASSNFVTGAAGNSNVISITTPAAITGTASATVGSTSTLANTSAGGVWSSSNTAVGTVSTGGVVKGISAGTTVITYTLNCQVATKTFTVNAYVGNWYSQGTTDVNTPANWNTASNGSGSPASASDFTNALNTWNVQSNMTQSGSWTIAGSLNLGSGFSITDGGNTISVGGNITGTGSETGSGGITMTGSGKTISGASLNKLTLNNAGGFSLSGSATISGVLTFTAGKLSIGSNTLNLNGAVASMSGTNAITGGATSNLSIGATGSIGSLFLDQTTPGTTNKIATFSISNIGGSAIMSNSMTVSTSLSIVSGASLDMGANVLAGAFTPSLSGTLFTQCSAASAIPASLTWGGTVNYNATSNAQTMQIGTFTNLALANHGSNTVSLGSGTINCSGNFAVTTGSTVFSTSGNTFVYTSTTGGQTVGGITYQNLTMSNTSGTNTVSGGDITMNNIITVPTGGTLDMGTNRLLGLSSAQVRINGTLKTGALSGAFTTTAIDWTTGSSTGTILYAGASAQSVIANHTYYNLAIGNGSAITYTASSTSATTVTHTLTVNANAIYDLSSSQLLGSGSFAASIASTGTLQTSQSTNPAIPAGATYGGTVIATGAGAVNIPAATYNNLMFTGSTGAKNLYGSNINGDLTINLTNPSSGNVSLQGNIRVAGSIYLTGSIASTFDVNTTPYSIAVGGGFSFFSSSNVQLLNARLGTVKFVGTGAQSITAALSSALPNFYNVEDSNASGTLTFGANTAVDGSFTIDANATVSLGSTTLSIGSSTVGSGNFTNNGTFTAGTSTVNMKGSSGTASALAGSMTGTNKFNNLTFTNSSGSVSFSNSADVANNFTITSGTLTAPAGTLKVGGTFSNNTSTFAHNNGTVEFNGSGGQSFPGANATTFKNLNITNIGGTITAGQTVTVNGTLQSAGASNLNMVTFQLLGTPSASSFAGTLQTQYAGGGPAIPLASTWGGTVIYNSTTTSMSVAQGTYNNLTILGTSGSRTITSGTTTVTSNLSVGDGSTTTGVTSLGGPLVVGNNISIGSTSTANIFDVTSSNYQISVGGNWTQFSSGATNPFNAQSGTVLFNGSTGTQTISVSSGTGVPTFYDLTVSNSSFPLNISNSINASHSLTVSANAQVVPVAAAVFNSSAASGTISGSGTIQVTRTAATADFSNQYKFSTNTLSSLTVDYTANAAQSVNSFTYGTLKTSTSGVKTATGNITVNNGLNVGASTTLDMSTASRLISGTAPTYTVTGTLKTSVPTATSPLPIPSGITWGGTVEYGAGTGAQTVVLGTYNNLALDNTSGTNATGGAISVNGTLTLGNLTLGANTLTLGSSSTISGASTSNYIVAISTGKLRQTLTANGTFSFPIGDATNYSPLSLVVSGSGYSSAYAEAKVTAAKHPNNGSATDFLSRYWTVATSGITGQSYDLTGTYVAGDVHGTEATIKAAQYTGSLPWIKFGFVNTGAKTISATSISSSSSDFTGLTGANPTVSISPTSATICNGSNSSFTATGSGDPTFSYAWTPATGLTSTNTAATTASPTVTTTYTVTATDGNGLTANNTILVTVNTVATSTGATNNGPGCIGSSITLNDNSSNATIWSWTGPGGYTSSLQNPSVTPTVTSTYSLTVANASCATATVYTTTVTITPMPTSTGVTNNGAICVGGTVTLSANSSNATIWSWVGSDGFTSTLQNPTATPSSTTTYSLTVSNAYCTPVTVYTTSVTVNPLPLSSGVTNDGPICVGGTVNLSANSSNTTSWVWTGSDGFSSSANNPTATPTVTTTYSLTVSSVGIGCAPATVYTTAVTVNVVPTSSGATNDGPICIGGTVNLNSNTTGATAWSWIGSDGFSSSATNPSATPTVTTTYSLTVSRSGSGCSPATVYTTAVTVNSVPTSSGVTNNGPICIGGTATLTANSSGATSWSWTGSDGFTSALQNPTATPTVTTTYSLTVSRSGSGCSPATVYTTAVTVNPLPSSSGVTNNGPICVGGTVNLSANSSNTTSWSWVGSDGFSSSANNPTATPTVTTTYSLTVSSVGIGCAPSSVYTTAVTVNAVPTSTGATNDGPICNSGTVNLSSNTTGATAWSWTGSDGFSSSATNPSATPTVTTTYSLTVSRTGSGCNPATVYTTAVTVNSVPTSSGATNGGPICLGGSATLSANSTGATAWNWTGSDGFSSTTQNPTATPTVTTTYSLTVSRSGNGCNPSTVYTTTVTVNGYPTAGPTNDGPICVSGTVNLTANPAGGASIYSWSGPNLSSSTVQNPTATPTVTSTYSLTVSSTGSGCTPATVYITAVTVNSVPTSSGATNDGPICVGGTVNLSSNTTGATVWAWTGSDGFSSSSTNPSATPTVTTTYSLTVSTTGSGCNPATVYTTAVTVNAVPSSTGASNGGPICIGGTAAIFANSTGATAWSWTGSDGFTSSAQNPTPTPTVTTTYSLTVSRPGSGCNPALVYTTAVTVNPNPTAAPTNGGPICKGGTVTLTANPAGGASTYLWTGPGTFTSTVQNPTATPTVTSTYSLTVTDGSGHSGCGSVTSYTTSVTVNPTPTASPTNNGPMCINGTVTMAANPAGGVTGYSWAGPNLSSTTSANPTVTPTVTSTYSLTVTSGASSGCSPSTVHTSVVTVFPIPIATPSNNGPICRGGSVVLSANPSGGAVAYSWSGPNMVSTSVQNPTATPTVTSTFSVTVTNNTGLSGCSPTTVYTTSVVVNTSPSAAPTNSGVICSGGTVTLTANPSGGATAYSWTGAGLSSNTAQNPTATPTVTSTYSVTVSSGSSSGCSPATMYTTIVTVNTKPIATPTNSGPVCLGNSATLISNPSGGANTYLWSGANLSSTTVQNPTANPSSTSVYSLTVTDGSGLSGCSPSTIYTTTLTINPSPATITGTQSTCIGTTSALSASGSGAWSSSNTSVATVVSSTGVVSGIAAGTATITYTLGTGCLSLAVFTVNPSPSSVSVSGGGTFCGSATLNATGGSGGTIYFQGTTSGGTSTATVSSSQVVTSSGTYYFRSLSADGCWGTQGSATVVIPTITGITTICPGTTSTLSDIDGAGTWTSTNALVATIGSTSGLLTGVAAGTATITYVPVSGCTTTTTVTVITAPASISGASTVCGGQTTTYANTTTGGIWSSGAPTIATVGSTGIVTGIAGGLSATISYSFGSGCTATKVVSVNPLSAISGSSTSICQGRILTLTDATSGGSWSSSAITVATVGTGTGIVTSVTAGTTTISYSMPTGCTATYDLVINPMAPNTGSSTVCVGQATTLSNSIVGGIWTSGAPTIATVDATGNVTGIGGGLSAVISYSLSSGCITTTTVNVYSFAAITGSSNACVGQSTTISDAIPGGTWSSSNIAVATIGSISGIVNGVSTGTVTMTYLMSTGCTATFQMTVNPVTAISGPTSVCAGQTITLSDATAGGTWSSSNLTMATVGSSSGVVTGNAGGFTPTITYTLGSGCIATITVTVNQLAGITGPAAVCQSQSATFSNAYSGGSWASADIATITIGSTGVATGVAAGTAIISYSMPTGCTSTAVVRVSPSVDPTGSSFVCTGSTSLMSDAVTPGTWLSSMTAVATIGSLNGIVSGITPGTSMITYKVSASGCRTTFMITVKLSSGVITGSTTVCAGTTTTYTNVATSGSWGSDNTAIATVGSATGIVTGVAAGTATITYTTGCGTDASQVITVINSAITGATILCNGNSTTLTNASAGGVWESSNTAVATIGTGTGLLSTVSVGTSIISYTNSGCSSTSLFYVTDVPAAIGGTALVCPAASGILTNSVPYGTWSSGDVAVATIGSTSGVLSGVGAGTCTITYTTGCGSAVTVTATVNTSAGTVSGAGAVCIGTSAILTSSGGGVWTSSNIGVATIGTGTGIVTGVSSGTTTITFTSGTGCNASRVEIVNNLPSAISGTASVCEGATSTLSNTGGGVWSSANGSVATIGSSSGIMIGVLAGTTTITYTAGTGCYTTTIATVNPTPAAISGSSTVCIGFTTTLSDAGGGTWSSSDVAKATIGSASGIVTGVAFGASTITYTLPTGCYNTLFMVVNSLPSAISGTANLCTGNTTSLSDPSFGGTWSSSNTSVATVGTGSGTVSGISAGTTTITYTVASGCIATRVATVYASPSAITGSGAVCVGSTTTLSDAGGGTWSISGGLSGVAMVGSASGIVSGVSPGSLTVTYTLGNGCIATTLVTVYPVPSVISGTASVCTSTTTTLTDAGGGIWSSSDDAVATIGSSSGIVSGIIAGSATMTYTLSTGCIALKQVTVNTTPSAISGTLSACVGLTTALTSSGSGTWSSSSSGVAAIGTSGLVLGVSAGTSTISYVVASGCSVNTIITINPLPAAISGNQTICFGLTSTLSDAGGGTWSSSDPATASVGLSTGIVSGDALGTATITYTLGTGCIATTQVTVNALPSAITGTLSACVGLSSTLSDAGGGTWSSASIGIATIGSTSGIFTGVSAGNAIITYTLATGCIATAQVTINAVPASITGTTNACVGSTSTLTGSGGGNWSSGDDFVATIGSSSGIVTGIAAGTTTMTYTFFTGCITTSPFTVNSLPAAISGNANICFGLTSTFSEAGGGIWTSSDAVTASVGSSSGIVTGNALGTATITYTLATGCLATLQVTVNSLPSAISGTTTLCMGSTTTLNDAGGGTWTSGSTGVATIGSSSGTIAPVSSGTSIITYALPTGCIATTVVLVNPFPSAISGTLAVCAGLNTTLTDVGGGVWSSSDDATATIGSSSGIVNGLAAGSATVTYTLATGCYTTAQVIVNPLPSAISGTTSVCIGSITTLSNAGSGTWSSSSTSFATVGSLSGDVSGIASGTTTITYTLPTGCIITTVVTVNALPSAISGANNVCTGLSTTLTDAGGGIWSNSDIAVASIGSSSGIITGTGAGTTTVTYTLGTGCIATKQFTVNPLPGSISGITYVCVGTGATTLTDGGSGTWTSNATGVATIGLSSGIVNAIAAGTATITYTLATGCIATTQLTVNPLPSAITGTTSVCFGLTTALSDAGGGTWTSSDPSTASVDIATGIVTSAGTGTATITYTLATGCIASTQVTVNPLPSVISGSPVVCVGLTTTLSNTGGGTWSSSATGVATVGVSTGIVTGVAAGISTITYRLPTGCIATVDVTVNPLPSAISGTTGVCIGNTSTLTDGGGGTWSSSNGSVATIGSTSGVVLGIAPGTATITYTLSTGCLTTVVTTVTSVPAPISGTVDLALTGSSTLTDPTSGGYWLSSNTLVATIGSSTGFLTGVGGGTATISYILPTGCSATTSVNVYPVANISGSSALCVTYNITLTDATPGGVWTSSNIGVATIGSTTGIVTGVSFGTSIITYNISGTGFRTSVITVQASPTAIVVPSFVCVGQTITVTDATTGGYWTSGTPSIATVGSGSGVVTGVAGGLVATISYTIGSGCSVSASVSVNSLSAITGATSVCAGQTTTLANATGGGTWVSSTTAVATIGTSTGILTGVASGTTTVSYVLPSGCTATFIVSVDALSPISGPTSVCFGQTITLTNSGGGTWSSASPTIASVDVSTGIVTGAAGGLSTTITYILGSGCKTTTTVSVNALGVISGTMNVCAGNTTTLTNSASGGSWISSNASVATVGTGTGLVSGVGAGTTTISYLMPTGCLARQSFTVNALSPITGATSVCVGQTITLSDATAGGVWSSGSPSIASVGTNGIVTGVAGNLTASISYTMGTGCRSTYTITVNPLAATTGAGSLCTGQTLTLSNTVGGGTWTSSAIGVATVGTGTGIVTGVGAGTATISYSLASGCVALATVTVNALSAITVPGSVCVGSTITLTDVATGGTWVSGSTGIATIGASSGIVTGNIAGTSIITYSLGSGCSTTATVVVNALSPITGTTSLCGGSFTTLSDATAGGTWTSSATGVATVGTGTGIVTGVTAGTATISYSLASGCLAITTVSVSPGSSISGATSVCVGQTITLTASGGGTWSTSAPSIATVGVSSGIVTGVAGGLSATITYSLGSGCKATVNISVNSLGTISGTFSACVGQTTTLTNSVAGGTWSSASVGVATVGSASGIVTGVSAGTTTISYIMPGGCFTTASVNIANLSAITGSTSVCVGKTISLSNAAGGGTWTSSAPSIASVVSTTGVVTGAAAGYGTANITYTLGSGCKATTTISVNALGVISGSATSVCVGQTTTLTNSAAGGTWSTSAIGVSSIGSASGIVTGIAAGTNVISYIMPTGCTATYAMTVNALSPISGPTSVCKYASITLTDATPGGTWASSAPTIASVVTATGVVTGAAPNLTANITYTLSNGCRTSIVVSVNPIPTVATISGASSVSMSGGTITLTNATAGGEWSSSNGHATVGSTTGVVTGVSLGTSIISYTVTNASGCAVSDMKTITVGPVPPPHIIPSSGTVVVCIGSKINIRATSKGGYWSIDNRNMAIIDAENGIVTGIETGRTIVSYTVTDGWNTTISLTEVQVNPIPDELIISASTARVVSPGQRASFAAAITNGGTNPVYQWQMNGVDVAGANSPIFVTNNISGYTEVTCIAGSSAGCSGHSLSKTYTVNAANSAANQSIAEVNISLLPNPNKGDFYLRGTVGITNIENLTVEVTNMLGQVVYSAGLKNTNGNINEEIHLGNRLVNGNYLLNLKINSANQVFHFVVEQ